jgi:predicted ATPase/class 3 adenylate cyclase
MSRLPEGVITFLFTDVEGSTRLWEESPETMRAALVIHDEVIESSSVEHNGVPVKERGEGDSHFVVFGQAGDAVSAVASIQKRLADVDWPTPRPLKVRVALHTGTADVQLGDYYGPAVNRAARLRAIAHGGQTVLSGATWELVQDGLHDGVSVLDLGEHTLKDLTRPERVYQLNVEGLDQTFPPLTSLDSVPNNLPQQLTDFVGRQGELTEATRLLGETRLLTILAPGGTGKTRLGIQAAADVVSEYPDGAFFVSLAEVSSTDQIVQAIGEALGVSYSSDQEPQTQLLAYISSRRQLLILDNFEHVVDSASVVSAILHAAPDVTVIATSRAKLNVNGETVLALAGLETKWENDDDALGTSGVRLFLDAAKRSDSGFTLDRADLPSLSQILGVTGGMPLGILLAAAWVDMLPISEIAAEVSKNLDFLETEMGDIPDRHRSVRAVFDYSWNLLSPEEREAFAALSVFRGGFTREAAQAVADASLRGLASLVNKSLVTPTADKSRYTIHELLRQYAETELQTDEQRYEEIQDRHARFYAEAKGDYKLFFTGSQPEFLEGADEDLENLRVAWRRSLSSGDAETTLKMSALMQIIYEIRGWYLAGFDLFGGATQAYPEYTGDQLTDTVRAMSSSAQMYYKALLGQPDSTAARDASDHLGQTEDRYAYWFSLQSVALNMSYEGLVDEMVECTDEMISVGQGLEHPLWQVGGHNWRSLAAILQQDIETARGLLTSAMEVYERIDEHYYMTWNLWLQAMIATTEQRPTDAIRLLAKQVERCQQIGYRRGTMVGLEGLGQAHLGAGALEDAERAFIAGLEVAEQSSIAAEMLGMMVKTARVWVEMGRLDDAVRLLATVVAEPLASRQTMSETESIHDLATHMLEQIQPDIDAETFASAQAQGSSKPYEVAVKELVAVLR